jgi:lipopolysaccharide export LptBFGC system permease protein LptF
MPIDRVPPWEVYRLVDRRLTLALGWAILLMWVGSMILDAVSTTYEAPPTIHALMMLLAGAAFGNTLRKKD